MMIPLGSEEKEYFIFPNNFEINIDYGIMGKSSLSNEDHYISGAGRSRGSYKRVILFKNGKLLSKYIEKNKNRMSFDQRQKIKAEGGIVGDEFERIFDFPNGYSAKIEYWISPTERDPKCGMYTSKYRKMILKDENENIISEIFEDNLDYIDFENAVSDEEMYADGYTCY